MVGNTNRIKGIVIILALVFLVQPGRVYAWAGGGSRHQEPKHHNYPKQGKASFWLPGNSVRVSLGGLTFYYGDGAFYRRSGPRYVVVSPPCGAVVSSIPFGHQTVVINGVTYYTGEGVYYKSVGSGYVVVEPSVVAAQALARNSGETYTVNILNYRGSYTKVVVRRVGDGFVGPQGEYYSDFPTVEQLQAMYARR